MWKTFAKLQGNSYEDFSVVIEDVQFHRATIMPKEGENFTSHTDIHAFCSFMMNTVLLSVFEYIEFDINIIYGGMI